MNLYTVMASGSGAAAAAEAVVKTEPGVPSAAERILAICGEIPDGVSDKILKVGTRVAITFYWY